jgi:hypothetical protein
VNITRDITLGFIKDINDFTYDIKSIEEALFFVVILGKVNQHLNKQISQPR